MEDLPTASLEFYEYITGIRNINIKANEYYPTAVFVTNDIIKDKNIRYIEIEAYENHPVIDRFKDNKYATSVEYYISYNNNDWIPILPKNKEKVENEAIIFISSEGNNKTGELMFWPDISKEIEVYYNGTKLRKDKYAILGKTITIKTQLTIKDTRCLIIQTNQNLQAK